jgi:hypothetical protein
LLQQVYQLAQGQVLRLVLLVPTLQVLLALLLVVHKWFPLLRRHC